MTIRRIGPIAFNLGNHRATWVGPPDQNGMRPFSIDGTLEDPEDGRQLLELVSNPLRRVTLFTHEGVLEYLDGFDDYQDLSGWCLLQEFQHEEGVASLDAYVGWSPCSISGVSIPKADIVVVYSAAARSNVHSLAGARLIAQPFTGDAAGEPFRLAPTGRVTTRSYDPTTEVDLTVQDVVGREMVCYTDPIS